MYPGLHRIRRNSLTYKRYLSQNGQGGGGGDEQEATGFAPLEPFAPLDLPDGRSNH